MVVLGGQGVRILAQVASVAVLSRMLSPRDYGLVAMVLAVIAVAEIFRDLGLSTAAVQAKVLTREQQTNLWWVNTALGLGLALVAVAAAPLIAALYDEPVLTTLTAALAGMFVLNGMAAQYRADLTRRMLFTRLAAAATLAPLVALGIAAYAAANGAGYWALVVQQLVQGVVTLVGVGIFAGWLPGRPRRGVEMGEFLRFGWSLAGTQLINYAASNIDSVLIGTRLGASQLGTYNRAWQLLMNPLGQLRGPTTTVALPVLSRIRDNPALTQRFVQRGQVALGYSLGAGLGLVAGAATPVCALFLGPGWDVAGIFALLACAGLFQTLAYVGYWVYLAHGLTTELRHYTLVASVLKVVCIVVGVRYGITGAAAETAGKSRRKCAPRLSLRGGLSCPSCRPVPPQDRYLRSVCAGGYRCPYPCWRSSGRARASVCRRAPTRAEPGRSREYTPHAAGLSFTCPLRPRRPPSVCAPSAAPSCSRSCSRRRSSRSTRRSSRPRRPSSPATSAASTRFRGCSRRICSRRP
jgi:PST family polysaccharide transporter